MKKVFEWWKRFVFNSESWTSHHEDEVHVGIIAGAKDSDPYNITLSYTYNPFFYHICYAVPNLKF